MRDEALGIPVVSPLPSVHTRGLRFGGAYGRAGGGGLGGERGLSGRCGALDVALRAWALSCREWVRGRVAGCCGACLAARCYCMTAGWGGTEVPMEVSSQRLAHVLHRHLAEHGLLSFLSLLGAF